MTHNEDPKGCFVERCRNKSIEIGKHYICTKCFLYDEEEEIFEKYTLYFCTKITCLLTKISPKVLRHPTKGQALFTETQTNFFISTK